MFPSATEQKIGSAVFSLHNKGSSSFSAGKTTITTRCFAIETEKKRYGFEVKVFEISKKIDTELDLRFLSLGQNNRYGLHPYLHLHPLTLQHTPTTCNVRLLYDHSIAAQC